jgi:hypothetical protein
LTAASAVVLFDKSPSRDPTGTAKLRAAFRVDALTRLRTVRGGARRFIVDGGTSFYPPATRLEAFGHWLESAMSGELGGNWMVEHVRRAWDAGLAAAAIELQVPPAPLQAPGMLETLAFRERDGIASTVVQRLVRAAELAFSRWQAPGRAWSGVAWEFSKVADNRFKALADMLTIRSYNDAKLFSYLESNIRRVGVIPETRPKRDHGYAHDAILAEVLTAGDDDVCEDCLDIADDGPYEIAEVIGLLPAHPGCRCKWYPADDQRYAGDSVPISDAAAPLPWGQAALGFEVPYRRRRERKAETARVKYPKV